MIYKIIIVLSAIVAVVFILVQQMNTEIEELERSKEAIKDSAQFRMEMGEKIHREEFK